MHEKMTGNEVAQIVAEVQNHAEVVHRVEEASPAESVLHSAVLQPQALELRLRALEDRLHAVEEQLKAQRCVEAAAAPARTAARAPRMLAKGAEPASAAGVDVALGSLSVEQRMAVKAGLLRAGLL